MGKKSEDKKPEPKQKGGCVKKLAVLMLVLVLTYLGIHIWFLWQPVGKPDSVSGAMIDANVAGVRVFPALKTYSMDHIAGRAEILEGKSIEPPMLKIRLETAVERNYPITFREEEINAWLRKRIEVKQSGALAPFAKARGVWVDFKKDQVELIIEREIQGRTHVTSMFMQFNRTKNGYSIRRDKSHIGQVSAPGGFARLIMPAFDNLAKELSEELVPYKENQIRDIRVEEGKITLDPRKPEERL
ncbi:MAG: hypothetical protein AB8F34_00545 [Akkermansiaceae bacterium]